MDLVSDTRLEWAKLYVKAYVRHEQLGLRDGFFQTVKEGRALENTSKG